MAQRPSDEVIQCNFRIRESLRRRLERAALKNDRSLNSEIVARVEQSFEQEEAAPAMQALILENHRRVELLQRTGKMMRGWISDTLRAHNVDSAIANEVGEFVEKYLSSL